MQNSEFYFNKLNKYNKKIAMEILIEKEKRKDINLSFLILVKYKKCNEEKINKTVLEQFVIKKYYEQLI